LTSVKIGKLNVQIIQDTNAQMNMLLNGQLDLAGVSKEENEEK
jgi:ABC-type transport system substrate-binding protein